MIRFVPRLQDFITPIGLRGHLPPHPALSPEERETECTRGGELDDPIGKSSARYDLLSPRERIEVRGKPAVTHPVSQILPAMAVKVELRESLRQSRRFTHCRNYRVMHRCFFINTFQVTDCLSSLSCRFFRFSNQMLQCRVDGFRTGIPHPFVSDRSLGVEDVKCGRAGRVPLSGDGAWIRKRSPVEFFPGHHFPELIRFMVENIDADQGEWLLFQLVYERPLVRPVGTSSQSVFHPEIQQHDLAAIITQFELSAILIFPFDVRGSLAD